MGVLWAGEEVSLGTVAQPVLPLLACDGISPELPQMSEELSMSEPTASRTMVLPEI